MRVGSPISAIMGAGLDLGPDRQTLGISLRPQRVDRTRHQPRQREGRRLQLDASGLNFRKIEHVVDAPQQRLRESRIVATSGSWLSPSPCRSNTSIVPSTPFIGVRISGPIVARNLGFALLAASASARAASAAPVRSRSWAISRVFWIANTD